MITAVDSVPSPKSGNVITTHNGIVIMMFLDPKKPIATCETDSCDVCAINGNLHCHFGLRDWIHFLFIAFPPFLLGGAGIYYMNGWLLIPWIILVFAFFGFIEIRVMCSQCMNFACPLNCVDEKVRNQFFDKNPIVAKAWRKCGNRVSD